MNEILLLGTQQQIGFMIFSTLLFAAALQDFVEMRISDYIHLGLITSFAIFSLPASLGWTEMALRVGVAIALFLIFIPVNQFGLMAGGDIKLIAASSLWFTPIQGTSTFLLVMTAVGGALAIVHLLVARTPIPAFFPNIAWCNSMVTGLGKIPYGIGISVGAFLAQLIIISRTTF